MDLPQIIPDEVTEQLAYVLDFEPEDVLRTSAKTREGILEVLDAIVERVPHPNGVDGDADEARALMFDSWYDPVRGFCGLIAVHDGCVRKLPNPHRNAPGHQRIRAANRHAAARKDAYK